MTTRSAVMVACAAEAVAVVLLLLAPGGGHSPLWFTQIVALLVVAQVSPSVGSCLSCAPGAWAIGIAAQTLVLVALVVGYRWARQSPRASNERTV